MGYHQCADIKPNKIDCLDSLQFQGLHLHKHACVEILSAADTMDAADDGKFLLIDTTAIITLPAVAAGYGPYTFVNYGEETAGISDVLITISPNASDAIQGGGLTAVNNKDLINTLATAKRGDYVTVIYGGANKWSIVEMAGVWAKQT